MLKISKATNYRNFGYLPRPNNFAYNLYASLFGNPNIIKRLQAPDIMSALQLSKNDTVLDFGCASGFFTVEIAKGAKMTHGIDIDPLVKGHVVPPTLANKLEFLHADGRTLPFENGKFDKILASEVLGVIPDRDSFMLEIRRMLKPGGALVVCNGAGHPAIADLFERKGFRYRMLKAVSPNFPESYEDYLRKISAIFGTETPAFLTVEDITELGKRHSFAVEHVVNTPRAAYGSYISWLQFLGFVFLNKPIVRIGFIPHYCLFSLFGLNGKKGHPAGIVMRLRHQA